MRMLTNTLRIWDLKPPVSAIIGIKCRIKKEQLWDNLLKELKDFLKKIKLTM